MKKININLIATYITIAFILISPFENVFRIEKIYYLLGIVSLAMCVLARKRIKKNKSLLLIVFIIYAFITTIWSPNANAAIELLNLCVVIIFLFFQLQFDYTLENFDKIKIAFVIQGGIMVMLCFAYGNYMDGRFWLQSSTSGADPNYLSGWFIIPICFIAEKLFDKSICLVYKIFMVLELIGIFYFIMESASRSGLITNVIALGLSILYSAKKYVKKHPIKCVLIIIIFIGIMILGVQSMPETMINRLANSNGNLGGRSAIWKELWAVITNSVRGMLFGMGSGSVTYYNTFHMGAHNTFFDIWFQYGIIGISLIGSYLMFWIRKKIRIDKYTVFALISMSIMIFTLSALSTRFVMLTLFVIGAKIVTNENINEKLR